MKTGDKFEHLAEYLSAVEGSGFEVTTVAARDEEDGLEADLTVEIPIAAAISDDAVDVVVENADLRDGQAISADLSLRVPDNHRDDTVASGGIRSEAGRPHVDEPGDSPADGSAGDEQLDGAEGASDDPAPESPESSEEALGKVADDAPGEGDDDPTAEADHSTAEADDSTAEDDSSAEGDDDSTPIDAGDSASKVAGDSASKDADDPPTDSSDAEDPEMPAYRDPERLRAVYEAEDTFEAMTEALGADVTPQTVRRHMIRHDIHEVAGRSGSGSRDSDEGDDAEPGSVDGGTDGRQPNLTPADGSTSSAAGVAADADDADAGDGDRSWPTERDDEAGGTKLDDEAGETGSDDPEDSNVDTDGVEPDDPVEARGDGGAQPVESGEEADPDGTATTPGADPGADPADDLVDVASPSGDAIDEFGDLDLPEGVEIEDVRASVRTARTLYDVQRDLGLDRERTRAMLQRLDLLDIVHGRVSRLDEETPVEEIDERIAATAGDLDANSRESAGD